METLRTHLLALLPEAVAAGTEPYLIVGAIYWIINQLLTLGQAWLETTLARRYQ